MAPASPRTAPPPPIQALLGHESLNTSQGYIDATAYRTPQAARANRTYRVLEGLAPKKTRRITAPQLELG